MWKLTLTHATTFTHHTSFPHQRGWFSCAHKEDRWLGPPGSSVQCQGSTPPLHHCPQACLPSRSSSPCPRQGSRCRSSCWDQLWRLSSPSWSLEQTRERPGIPKKNKKNPPPQIMTTATEKQRTIFKNRMHTVSKEHNMEWKQLKKLGHHQESCWIDLQWMLWV